MIAYYNPRHSILEFCNIFERFLLGKSLAKGYLIFSIKNILFAMKHYDRLILLNFVALFQIFCPGITFCL